ncbi:MAG TPA: TMEM175 family protein [Methanoregula sp.]|nr:TMEM175 family protein [Methanoregula sp.]
MNGQETTDKYHLSKNRLEALFDGIYAFSMTLLVTGFVIQPIPASDVMVEFPARIAAMRPEVISFLIAFFVLSSFWLVHQRQFHFVRIIDPVLVRITLFILAFTVMMPFTTNVSGDYSEVQIAVDLFHINMFILGLLFLIHWWYLVNNPHLTSIEISKQDAVNGMRRALVMPFVSFSGVVCSFASPSFSMAIYLLTPLLFFINRRYFTI